MIHQTYKGILLAVLLITVISADAQRRRNNRKATPVKKVIAVKKIAADDTAKEALADTSAPKVVTVTSAFKPSLKNAAKINFTAASPFIDSQERL